MLEEDRPPERIWLDDQALSDHFDRLQERRRSGSSSDGQEWESIPGGEFEQNEITAALRKK